MTQPISPYAILRLNDNCFVTSFFACSGGTVSLRFFDIFGPYQDRDVHVSGVLSVFISRDAAEGTDHSQRRRAEPGPASLTTPSADLLSLFMSPAGGVRRRPSTSPPSGTVTLNQSVSLLQL